MTLAELAVTIAVLGVLGLVASRFGLSAIPAYLLAGIILGPNEPDFIRLVQPSEVTDFVAEIGLIFLLFFLGLEFSVDRLVRSGRHVGLGGAADFVFNAGLGLLVGVAAFGVSFSALVLAACIYVSSSAIAVKALIGLPSARRRRDRPRAGDPPLRGRRRSRRCSASSRRAAASVSTTAGVSARRSCSSPPRSPLRSWLGARIGRLLDRLQLEFFLLRRLRLRRRDERDRERARHVRGDRRADGRRRPVRERRARGDRAAVLQLPRRVRRPVLLRLRAHDRSRRVRRGRAGSSLLAVVVDADRQGRRRARRRAGSAASARGRASTPARRSSRTASSRSSSPSSRPGTPRSRAAPGPTSSPSPASTCSSTATIGVVLMKESKGSAARAVPAA